MTAHSLRGAIDAKCRDCGATDAGSNWREHIACCPVVDCPLWRVRPLSRYAPSWLSSRDAGALPNGWRSLSHDAALAIMRNPPDSVLHDSVRPSCGTKARVAGTIERAKIGNAASGLEGVMGAIS